MGKYRILHVIDHLGPGGAQEVVRNLIKCADRDRFDHEVAALYGRGHYEAIFRDMGVPAHSLSPRKFLPLYVPRMFSLCKKKRYHVVHSHLMASNLMAKPLSALAGTPFRFNHDHVSDPSRRSRKVTFQLDRISNRFSTHIIAVTPATRDFLITEQGLDPDRVSVIINGVDLEKACAKYTGKQVRGFKPK